MIVSESPVDGGYHVQGAACQTEVATGREVGSNDVKEACSQSLVLSTQNEMGCGTVQGILCPVEFVRHAVGVGELRPGAASEVRGLPRAHFALVQPIGQERRAAGEPHHLVRIVMAKSPAPLQESLVKREPPKIGRRVLERLQAARGEEVGGGKGSIQGLVIDIQFGGRGSRKTALGAEQSGKLLRHLEVACLAPADEVQDHHAGPLGGKTATHELFKLRQSRMKIIQELPSPYLRILSQGEFYSYIRVKPGTDLLSGSRRWINRARWG